MKFMKRSNTWKASNVTLDMSNLTAYSYNWWLFLKKINGYVVFNDYQYSTTTARHQFKIRRKLSEIGIAIDYTIKSPMGLNNLSSAVNYYEIEKELLLEKINSSRTRKAKNQERRQQISSINEKLKIIERLTNENSYKQ
jgi:hypothetical protein